MRKPKAIMPQQRRRRYGQFTAGRIIFHLLLELILVVAVAAFAAWFIEYRFFENDASQAWEFVQQKKEIFVYSAGVMGLILLGLIALVRRPLIASSILISLITIFTYINAEKMRVRAAPLIPEDFLLADQAGSLMSFVDIWGILRLLGAVALIMLVGFLLDRAARKIWPRRNYELPIFAKYLLIPRAILLVVVALGLVRGTAFIREAGNNKTPGLGIEFIAWNQERNYAENGVVVGFLYNWQKTEVDEPAGYSKSEIETIKTKYTEVATAENATRTALADADYNLVIVMNESFYDPSIIHDYYPYEGGDVTPNLHRLQEQYPSGQMYSLHYGGGTADIEFESQTSLTNYWSEGVTPFVQLLPRLDYVPGVAAYAVSQGYSTTELHPYHGGMYKRNLAVPKEGYQTVKFVEDFAHTDRDTEAAKYVNDRSAYAELLDTLKSSDGKQLVTLITMQNHTPYNSDIYEEHQFTLPSIEDEGKRSELETYLQSVHNSDAYLGEFIAQLDAMTDQKTVVLFFGDHAAGIFENVNDADQPAAVRNLSYLTPYFVYANFDLNTAFPGLTQVASEGQIAEAEAAADGTEQGLTKLTTSELPTTTPNCLMNTVYDLLGVKKTNVEYLAAAACAEVPILMLEYQANSGNAAAVETSAIMKEYQLVSYDFLSGAQYWGKAE